jgi:hypothetical protein
LRRLRYAWLGLCGEESERFAETFTRLLAEDIAGNLPAGRGAQIAVGWIGSDDPTALRALVLGIEDVVASGELPLAPTDWPTIDRESERTDRLLVQKELREASDALSLRAAGAPDSEAARWGPSPALIAIARWFPKALRHAHVPMAGHFQVLLVHDEDSEVLVIRRTCQIFARRR